MTLLLGRCLFQWGKIEENRSAEIFCVYSEGKSDVFKLLIVI